MQEQAKQHSTFNLLDLVVNMVYAFFEKLFISKACFRKPYFLLLQYPCDTRDVLFGSSVEFVSFLVVFPVGKRSLSLFVHCL